MDSNQSPLADPVFYRTYSRRQGSDRETWAQATDRAIGGLIKLGKFTPAESDLLRDQCLRMRALPAGRWLWVGGTPWIEAPENYPGAFNCHNSHLRPSPLEETGSPWEVMGYLMQLAMMGCGVGRVCSLAGAAEFPLISRSINVRIIGNFGDVPKPDRQDETTYAILSDGPRITIGDSRQGWADAYQSLLEIASGHHPIAHADPGHPIEVAVDISHVRPSGERLAGFGGVANPIKLPDLFGRVAKILNHAIGRKLTPLELALISDEAALVVVAGNVRRCLPADALVHTATKGPVPISEVQVGDMVHTPIGPRRVTNKFDQGVQQVYRIEVAGDRPGPRATLNHRMAVTDEIEVRWVEVGNLIMGDCLVTPDLGRVSVVGVGDPVSAHTYDIEVEEVHCFYADGYLTHNSAGMVQLDSEDTIPVDWLGVNAATAKHGLWVQGEDGSWAIDPNRDALRMSNHTKVFMRRPTEQECIESVRSQYYSGEGAIQYAPEEIARANRDLLDTPEKRRGFFRAIEIGPQSAKQYLLSLVPPLGTDDFEAQRQRDQELDHRVDRYGLNPCGEATGSDFFCNLSTVCLNQQDPLDLEGQRKSFRAAGLYVAALLQQGFDRPRYQYSRSIDPIVLVSFTGGFDFFVKALGVDWLRWWEAGRPDWWVGTDLTIAQPIADQLGLSLEGYRILDWDEDDREISTDDYQFGDFYRDVESAYLSLWRSTVEQTIWEYCDRHGLRRPNRCTGLKPEGTLSLLTGASPGWHPPKAARFIRRVTFAKNDPIALACLDHGYSIVPSQSDKDENGNLLNDPFDPRCTEWLVEIPVAVSWADLPGADTIAIEKFSALAQFDFWMQVQKHYTTHSTSATIELRESEIEPLGQRIYQAIQEDEGYISAALLARFDDLQTFPRLPFEPISRETYLELQSAVESRRKPGTFAEHLARHDQGDRVAASEQGPAGCDSDKCLLPERK